MDKLVADFPKARIVFQNYPIAVDPSRSCQCAAEYGVCVTKLGGSTAFFQFAAAVFDGQDGLATPDGATLTLNSAVTKAGLDPAKVSACAATPEIKAHGGSFGQAGRGTRRRTKCPLWWSTAARFPPTFPMTAEEDHRLPGQAGRRNSISRPHRKNEAPPRSERRGFFIPHLSPASATDNWQLTTDTWRVAPVP